MKQLGIVLVLAALLAVPAAVAAQNYDDNYPSMGGGGGNDYPSGGSMGGGSMGGSMGGAVEYPSGGNSSGGVQVQYPSGGNSGGGIMVGGGSMGGGQHNAGATDVSIANFSFQPSSIFVHAGDTVTWHNNDSVDHTVTSNSGDFDSGSISPGGSYSQSFDTAGVYSYHCSIHPNMHGMVIVTG